VKGYRENKHAFRRIFPSPGGSPVTSLSFALSLARDAQSLHCAHDRDLVPDITASRRLDAAVSQLLRDVAEGAGPASALRSHGLKGLALSRVLEAQCFSWLGGTGISKDVDRVGRFCKGLPSFEGLRRLAIHFEHDSTFQHVDESRRWMSMLTSCRARCEFTQPDVHLAALDLVQIVLRRSVRLIGGCLLRSSDLAADDHAECDSGDERQDRQSDGSLQRYLLRFLMLDLRTINLGARVGSLLHA